MTRENKLKVIKSLIDSIQESQNRLATFIENECDLSDPVDCVLSMYLRGEPAQASELMVHEVIEKELESL